MELWIMWLIACGVLLVLEIFTVSFLLFFPGIAAFLAFIAAILGATIQVQAAIFVIASLVMIIFIRPVVAKIFKTKDVPMNSKNIIGKTALVLKDIDNVHLTGQVKVAGEVWSASSSTGEIITTASTVIIEKIDGVKLVVKKV